MVNFLSLLPVHGHWAIGTPKALRHLATWRQKAYKGSCHLKGWIFPVVKRQQPSDHVSQLPKGPVVLHPPVILTWTDSSMDLSNAMWSAAHIRRSDGA
jgi:hypothetical protein